MPRSLLILVALKLFSFQHLLLLLLCACVRACVRVYFCCFSTQILSTFPGTPTRQPVAGCKCREDVRAALLSTEVTCLMSSFGYQRNGFIAFDILLLELIRWLIIINTIYFSWCLHLTASSAICTCQFETESCVWAFTICQGRMKVNSL